VRERASKRVAAAKVIAACVFFYSWPLRSRAQLLFEWATNTPILFAHSSRRAADKDLICRPAVSYIYDIFRCAGTFIVTIIIFCSLFRIALLFGLKKDNPGGAA